MTGKDFFDLDFKEEKIDVKAIFYKYLRYWPLILSGVFITCSLAFVYLKTKTASYEATAKIQVLDNEETPSFSLDLKGLLGKSKVNLDNEIAVIKSYRIIKQVVIELDLNVSYFAKGKFFRRQMFSPPFEVKHILPLDSIKNNLTFLLDINDKGFLLKTIDEKEVYQTNGYNYDGSNSSFPVTITNLNGSRDYNITYTISVQNLLSATKMYKNIIKVTSDGKNSDLLKLSVQTNNNNKSKDIVNKLVDIYEKDGIKDRQKVFKRTIEFVDDRFKYLVAELEQIEQNKKEYKQENKISELEADSGILLQKNAIKEKELFQIETQLQLIEMLNMSLSKDQGVKMLPSNFGLNNEIINRLIAEYNTLLITYEKSKLSAGNNNPFLTLLENNLLGLRKNIAKSVNVYVTELNLQLKREKRSQGKVRGSFRDLPEKEKVLRNIERQQNLKESLYLLLLQKREESAINYAVATSKVKVIDYAIVGGPITPKKMKIYIIAIFAGFLMPILALYLRFLLNTKVETTKDIENLVKGAPILSNIPLLQNNEISESSASRGPLKESFRTLLTNAKFIIPKTVNNEGKTLLVTSSIKGEGKTLVSYNLASEISSHKSKVILIGADLRNPQLHKYLDVENVNIGLSSYLNDDGIKINDLEFFHSNENLNLDILFAGAIPPNPTSLLSNNRFEELLTELKKSYDYIIIDSAPTLLVSDTLIFGKLVDTTIYVTRANHTEKNIIEYSKRLIDEGKLNNVAYVLNGVDTRSGYGYNYNYAYNYSYTYDDDEQSKKWYQFFKN